MKPNELEAYNAFLHSGKVEDYLKYVGEKQMTEHPDTGGIQTTGDGSAYYDRRDRVAGARG